MKINKKCIVCGSENFEKFTDIRDYFLSGEDFSIFECVSCCYRFTHPFPDADKIGQYYKSENYVSHSDTQKGFFFKIYQIVKKYNISKKVAHVERYVKNGKILDYGCGTGDFLNGFERSKWHITGIEPDPETRAYAIQKNKIEVFDTSQLNTFDDNTFDVVTLWHVFEHISNPENILSQFRRIIKPGGILVVAVPNCASYDAVHYGKYWAAYDVPRHLHHFNPLTLKKILENEGLKMDNLRNMYFDSFYVSMLSEKYKKNKLGFVSGIFWGMLSNIFAWRKKYKASSIIYTSITK